MLKYVGKFKTNPVYLLCITYGVVVAVNIALRQNPYRKLHIKGRTDTNLLSTLPASVLCTKDSQGIAIPVLSSHLHKSRFTLLKPFNIYPSYLQVFHTRILRTITIFSFFRYAYLNAPPFLVYFGIDSRLR